MATGEPREYWRPAFTCDAVVLCKEHGVWYVLLIERAKEPFAGSWALPGGFLEEQEELEDGARRELLEETGIAVDAMEQLRTYGRPGRDPRGRTISVAYLAIVAGPPPEPRGSDDAARAAWHPAEAPPRLAFDHAEILADALACVRARSRPRG